MAKINDVLRGCDVIRYRKAMKELPILLGVTRNTFDKYCRNTTDISLKNAWKVVKYLNGIGVKVTLEEIVE